MRKLRNKQGIKTDQDVMPTLIEKDSRKLSFNRKSEQVSFRNAGNVSTTRENHSYDSFDEYSLNQIKNLTTEFGLGQNLESKDLSIYELEDNATALIIMCEHYVLTREKTDLELIDIYLNFIQYCLQPSGYFLKYVSSEKKFTEHNNQVNLADTTGCAIYALGYLISKKKMLPESIVTKAETLFQEALSGVQKIHSINAIAYIIKGLYYNNTQNETIEAVWLIKKYAKVLVELYKDVENNDWKWFQHGITIESSLISEALLCAWMTTGEPMYKEISKTSFDFLLLKIFKSDNSSFLQEEKMFEGKKSSQINTLIFALNTFHKVFKDEDYVLKIKRSAEWLQWNKFMQF